jgi:hypothetical protein
MILNNIHTTDPSTLEDLVLIMAKNIEQALIQAGAIPGTDYTIKDLFSLATPFALHEFKEGKISYVASW